VKNLPVTARRTTITRGAFDAHPDAALALIVDDRREDVAHRIAGAADRVVPGALTLSLAQHLRDTRSVVLPDVGHLSLAQAPQEVAGHLREFLV